MEQTSNESTTFDLRASAVVLRRQWRILATVTAAAVLASSVWSLVRTPEYEGAVELAIESVRSGSEAAFEDLMIGNTVVETERRVITSRAVADRVIQQLNITDLSSSQLTERVTVRTVTNTRVVMIIARDTDPVMSAAIANAFASSYLDYRRDRAIFEVAAARANLDDRAIDLQSQINQLDQEINSGSGGTIGSVSPDLEALRAQRDALAQQLALIGTQLASLDPGNSAIRGGGEILIPAEVPIAPVVPRPVQSSTIALIIGLLLGVGTAFVRDYFDDAIRGDDDIARVSGGRPVLGRITHWDDPAANERLITIVDPHDAASEEFQALSANIRFSLMSRQGDLRTFGSEYRKQSVLISSATPGEGKTSVSGNLAVASAAAGMRVILVGTDLRQPTIAARFGVPPGLGLSDLLVDARQLSSPDRIADHLVDVGIPRLRLLPAGTIPPNPTELLASPQMEWLHGCLTAMADLVIYDTPPLLPVADTLQVAPHVDTCIIVARTIRANRRELQHAVERLDGIGADIAGFVVNDVSVNKRSAYGYGYGYTQGTYRPRETGNTPGTLSTNGLGTPAQSATAVAPTAAVTSTPAAASTTSATPVAPAASATPQPPSPPAPAAAAQDAPAVDVSELDPITLMDAFAGPATDPEPSTASPDASEARDDTDDLTDLGDDELFTSASDGTSKSS